MQPQASTNIFKSVLLLWLDLCYRKTVTPQSQPTTRTRSAKWTKCTWAGKERKEESKQNDEVDWASEWQRSIHKGSIYIYQKAFCNHDTFGDHPANQMQVRVELIWFGGAVEAGLTSVLCGQVRFWPLSDARTAIPAAIKHRSLQ